MTPRQADWLRRHRPRPTRAMRGLVLLEVVLAMALFALSAAVLLGSMNAATRALSQVNRQTQGTNLAHSVMAMIESGMLAPRDGVHGGAAELPGGPEDWTWQAIITDADPAAGLDSTLVRVEVIVTHTPTGRTHRLTQWLRDDFVLETPVELFMEPEPL